MTNPSPATAEKKALLRAFDTVLKTQADEREAEQRAAEARRLARARSRPLMWVCAAVMIFITGYLWVEQPEWVFPARAQPESMAVKEASLRIGMANAAQHVERYRQRNGRLPASLSEAGAHGGEIDYEALGADGWRLMGSNGPARLTLTSAEPLTKFLGNSFEVISRRRS
ncbi:MAG: hypothetical protein H0T68_10350 [Gemmatimonadales bacterium]|nr:hypothetical protein [Gemmatimonadales bacterium]